MSAVNLKYQICQCFFQTWQAALGALNPNPTDNCPLYLNLATVAALPSRVSRHNSPSSAHFLSRLVRSCLPGGNNRCIVVSIFIICSCLSHHNYHFNGDFLLFLRPPPERSNSTFRYRRDPLFHNFATPSGSPMVLKCGSSSGSGRGG